MQPFDRLMTSGRNVWPLRTDELSIENCLLAPHLPALFLLSTPSLLLTE